MCGRSPCDDRWEEEGEEDGKAVIVHHSSLREKKIRGAVKIVVEHVLRVRMAYVAIF